jgi:transposase
MENPMRVGPRYTEQFKSDAVEHLLRSDRSVEQVAHDLGVSPPSLRKWYKASPMGKRKKRPARVVAAERALEKATPAQTPEEQIARLQLELAAVRKENEELREDRAILKKAAAFFAKESE